MFARNADGSGQSDSIRVSGFAETVGAFLPAGDRADDLELPQIHALSLYAPCASLQESRCAARVR